MEGVVGVVLRGTRTRIIQGRSDYGLITDTKEKEGRDTLPEKHLDFYHSGTRPPQTAHIALLPVGRQVGTFIFQPGTHGGTTWVAPTQSVLDVALYAKVHGSKEPQDVLCGYVRN